MVRTTVTAGLVTAALVLTATPALAEPGDQLWRASIGYVREGSSYLKDVAVGADGTVYVLSDVDPDPLGDDYHDVLVAAFRPDGRRLWVAPFDRDGRSEEFPAALAVDDTRGRVYVTGFTYRPVGSTGDAFLTVAFDASTGGLLWNRTVEAGAFNTNGGRAIAVDETTGTVYATGATYNGVDEDYLTVAYSPTGQLRWSRTYDTGPQRYDGGQALELDAAGNLYVAGNTVEFGTREASSTQVLSYASDGTLRWVYGETTPDPDLPFFVDIEVDPARERVYVSAGADYRAGERVLATRALRLDGRLAWTAVERFGAGAEPTQASQLTVDPASGAVYVANSVGNFTEQRVITLGYAATGTRLWSTTVGVDSYAADIGVDPTSGRVYVVGRGGGNALVTAYSAAGEPVWTADATGPGDPRAAEAVAVDPDRGQVYVGSSVSPQYVGVTAYTA